MAEINKEAIERHFEDSQIKQRKSRGNKMLSYIDTPDFIRRINEVFEYNWSFEVVDERIESGFVIVKGKITAAGITKMQFGGKPLTTAKETGEFISVDDDFKAAASDCLKKCASLFGIGLHLYSDELDEGKRPPQSPKGNNQPAGTEKPKGTGGSAYGKVKGFAYNIGIGYKELENLILSDYVPYADMRILDVNTIDESTAQNIISFINTLPITDTPYLINCLASYVEKTAWKIIDDIECVKWINKIVTREIQKIEELKISEGLILIEELKKNTQKKGIKVILPKNPAIINKE